MKSAVITLFGFLATQIAFAAPEQLTLSTYLEQVAGQSPSVAAARLHSESGPERAGGAEVLTFPYLFANLSAFNDKSETLFPAQQGTSTEGDIYALGVGWNSPFGLNGRYTWSSTYTNSIGVVFPSQGRYTSYNKLDATLNLSRNAFGSEINARKDLLRSGSTAQGLLGKFQQIARLSEAESAYWRLAFARQTVAVQKDVLARAERLLNWAKRRVGLQLGDRGDLLQAQAIYELHNLELTSSIEEEKNASRAFNLLRNKEGDSVSESVALPSLEETLRMREPQRETERLDVQAAAERTKATQAQAQIEKEALKPSIDVVAAYAWNGREQVRSDAITEAFGSKHPSKSIGVNLTIALDAPTWTRAIRGANRDIEAANYELEQTRISENKDWSDLTYRLNQARKRLKQAKTVETVQQEKYENERQRLQRGRTTTFQALTFEQDYASAQLLRLRTQAEVLQILAQMKSFRGNL